MNYKPLTFSLEKAIPIRLWAPCAPRSPTTVPSPRRQGSGLQRASLWRTIRNTFRLSQKNLMTGFLAHKIKTPTKLKAPTGATKGWCSSRLPNDKLCIPVAHTCGNKEWNQSLEKTPLRGPSSSPRCRKEQGLSKHCSFISSFASEKQLCLESPLCTHLMSLTMQVSSATNAVAAQERLPDLALILFSLLCSWRLTSELGAQTRALLLRARTACKYRSLSHTAFNLDAKELFLQMREGEIKEYISKAVALCLYSNCLTFIAV